MQSRMLALEPLCGLLGAIPIAEGIPVRRQSRLRWEALSALPEPRVSSSYRWACGCLAEPAWIAHAYTLTPCDRHAELWQRT